MGGRQRGVVDFPAESSAIDEDYLRIPLISSRKGDLLWGVRLGLIIGSLYAVLALILYGTGGSARFEKLHTTVFSVIAVYLIGGLSAGIVLGIFRPALQQRYSAFVVSVIAAMPVAAGLTILATDKFGDWTLREWSTTAFLSLFVAAVGVAVLWKDPEGSDPG